MELTDQQFFEKHKYLPIKQAIDKSLATFISKTLLIELYKGGFTHCTQVVNSFTKSEPYITDAILLKIWKIMEQKTGLTLCPTYSYVRYYPEDSKLNKHTDRNSCEISATMCLGYDPSCESWPIKIETDSGDTIDLYTSDPGDMIIYKGCEVPHWREPLKGKWWLQVFLHYIDVNGIEYPQYAYNGRNYIPSFYKDRDFMDKK